MERIALFPGSFDPFTRGHAALVAEALHLFDRVIVGIGNNLAKEGLLSVGNRKRLIDDRGVRNTTDFEYERTMEAANHRLFPAITTVMLFTPAEVADIASSTVREVHAFGRSVEEFMPEGVDIEKYL